jgi:hypothetical protein
VGAEHPAGAYRLDVLITRSPLTQAAVLAAVAGGGQTVLALRRVLFQVVP